VDDGTNLGGIVRSTNPNLMGTMARVVILFIRNFGDCSCLATVFGD
jgi:hypothetical protein